jgi:hypothetical protein
MKQFLKAGLISFIVMTMGLTIFAQEDKPVTITCNGTGATLEEAKKVALRSAIEQAFGAFISSNTEILNDKVVSDQIISVTNGSIQNYETLSESQFPDGRWGTTIKANVSVGKLTSFVQSKGVNVEIKGGLFAINIKQQMLNEQGEEFAVLEMVKILHEQFQNSFDYTLETSTPIAEDGENKNWSIPLTVIANCNKNIEFCEDYFVKTMKALTLTPSDVKGYRELKKMVYPITLIKNNKKETFYLRNKNSVFLLYTLTEQWESYLRGYKVSSGDSIVNYAEKKFELSIEKIVDYRKDDFSFQFLNKGEKAGSISWSEERTLNQIENMTGFSVKPIGIRSHYRKEGLVIYENANGHGLLASWPDPKTVDLDYFSKTDMLQPYKFKVGDDQSGSEKWKLSSQLSNDALKKIDTLQSRGFNDWRVPTLNELKNIDEAITNYGLPFLTYYIIYGRQEIRNNNEQIKFEVGNIRLRSRLQVCSSGPFKILPERLENVKKDVYYTNRFSIGDFGDWSKWTIINGIEGGREVVPFREF